MAGRKPKYADPADQEALMRETQDALKKFIHIAMEYRAAYRNIDAENRDEVLEKIGEGISRTNQSVLRAFEKHFRHEEDAKREGLDKAVQLLRKLLNHETSEKWLKGMRFLDVIDWEKQESESAQPKPFKCRWCLETPEYLTLFGDSDGFYICNQCFFRLFENARKSDIAEYLPGFDGKLRTDEALQCYRSSISGKGWTSWSVLA